MFISTVYIFIPIIDSNKSQNMCACLECLSTFLHIFSIIRFQAVTQELSMLL